MLQSLSKVQDVALPITKNLAKKQARRTQITFSDAIVQSLLAESRCGWKTFFDVTVTGSVVVTISQSSTHSYVTHSNARHTHATNSKGNQEHRCLIYLDVHMSKDSSRIQDTLYLSLRVYPRTKSTACFQCSRIALLPCRSLPQVMRGDYRQN